MQVVTSNRVGSTLGLDSFESSLAGRALLALGASVFVALCAHISVPLPFTPVPLTLGNMGVLMVGLALSPRLAFSSLLLYLAEGALGAPVFNPGGPGGLAQLVGPTGGFLFAYPLAAAVVSALVRAPGKHRFLSTTASCSLATLIVLCFGVTWLSVVLHLTPSAAFRLGAAPFLPGEVIKLCAASGIYRALADRR